MADQSYKKITVHKTYDPKEYTMTEDEMREACLKGDLSRQWFWHEAFRDASKNAYRTSTSDTIHDREVAVTSDYPSGYGGHVPVVQHDLIFKNTGTYRKFHDQGVSLDRDNFPCFMQQKSGTATFQQAVPQEETPTFGSLPDVRVQPPWAITPPVVATLCYKTNPDMNVARR